MSLFLSYGSFRTKEKLTIDLIIKTKFLYFNFYKAVEFDVKSILEASVDLVLNNNMADLIGLNLNLKKFKSTVADALFNIAEDLVALAAVRDVPRFANLRKMHCFALFLHILRKTKQRRAI